jgi:hypothetical protein
MAVAVYLVPLVRPGSEEVPKGEKLGDVLN